MSDFHLALSINKALWDDLVGVALPFQVADGSFDIGRNVYQGVKQLGVRQKVAGLLEDRAPSERVQRARRRLGDAWRRVKPQVYKTLDEVFHVEGDWKVIIDQDGTDFHYGPQKIGVDAHVKASATGKVYLLKQNLEIPFIIEKRLGASCHLGDIRFDQGTNSVVGSVQDPQIDLGEHVIFKLLNEIAGQLIEKQTHQFSSVPLIPKDQLNEMVLPAGGALRMNMSVENVSVEVNESDLKLKVKFGFSQLQLTEQEESIH
jgi:hypothetical protein